MSLFVPFIDGTQVELLYHLNGQILTNRLWFKVVAGPPTTADLTAIGDGVRTWASDHLLPVLSQDIEFIGTRTYDATVAYPGPQVSLGASVQGGIADDSHSANVAVKVEFQTSVPPNLWLNWNFLGGIPKSAVSLNTIDPAYAIAVREAYVVLLDVFSLFEYRWEATRAVVNGITLSERDHFRIDHPRVRRKYVSQRRTRLNNPS